MERCKYSQAVRACVLVFTLIFTFTMFSGGRASAIAPGSRPTFAVLGPLDLDLTSAQQVSEFDTALAQAKSIGVEAVSIDVWIGKVQKNSANSFDWTYYNDVFGRIKNAGLKIIPILAFHRCGLGPGDDCDIEIPSWVFSLAPDMKYQSGKGNIHDDAIAVWATDEPAVLAAYENFYKAFGTQFGGMAGDFVEINISLGPTGELRYPSYNEDEWDYENNSRGVFQFYSQRAVDDFREYAMDLVGGNLDALNQRWGTNLSSPNDIRVPQNHDEFIDKRHYETTQYGRDLSDWYTSSLTEHGARLLNLAHTALAPTLPSMPLGMKIPGIHWQIEETSTPRVAEITAGVVQTTKDLRPMPEARRDAYGYERILDMVADVKAATGRDIILHFTAAEMDNDKDSRSCNSSANNTSKAEALVFWISQGAADRDITHKAENALGCVGGPDEGCGNRNWERIANVFNFAPYGGFSFLRLATRPDQDNCLPWNADDRQRYADFIQAFKNHRMVVVHLSEWEPCIQDDGCNYYVLTWNNGKPANAFFGLHYEGPQMSGSQVCRQWWTGVVGNVPAGFSFTGNHATGETGVWEGNQGQFDRTYNPSQHGHEIFALGRQNTSVFTNRPPCP